MANFMDTAMNFYNRARTTQGSPLYDQSLALRQQMDAAKQTPAYQSGQSMYATPTGYQQQYTGSNPGPNPTGGVPTGSVPKGVDIVNNQESIPTQPPIDYSGFDEAIRGLDDAVNAASGETSAQISGLESERANQLNRQQTYLTGEEATAALEENKARQIASTDTNQQRSALAEIIQGLQSLYGGTTGTGRFAGELAGRTAMSNIGQIQTNLANAIEGVRNSIGKIRQNVKDTIDQISMQTTNLIQKAKAELQTNLASIRVQKGTLQANKAQMANEAMQRYQDTVATINARNAAFKQQVALQQQKFEDQVTLNLQNKVQAAAMDNPETVKAFEKLTNDFPGLKLSGQGTYGGKLLDYSYSKPENQYAGLIPTGVNTIENNQTSGQSGQLGTFFQ